jgi:hypothetical protein
MPGFNLPIDNEGKKFRKFGGPSDELSDGPNHSIETARNYRFTVPFFKPLETLGTLPNSSKPNGLQFHVKSIQRPKMEFDEIIIHNGQDEIYRPGKMRWLPIDITFYEVTNEKAEKDLMAESFYDWWSRRVADISTSRLRRAGIWTDDPNSGFYFNAQIDMLNGYGDPMWSYILYDCWPKSSGGSDLDYQSNDISEAKVTLRYNKAIELKE